MNTDLLASLQAGQIPACGPVYLVYIAAARQMHLLKEAKTSSLDTDLFASLQAGQILACGSLDLVHIANAPRMHLLKEAKSL
jgi:hypothetical protein